MCLLWFKEKDSGTPQEAETFISKVGSGILELDSSV